MYGGYLSEQGARPYEEEKENMWESSESSRFVDGAIQLFEACQQLVL